MRKRASSGLAGLAVIALLASGLATAASARDDQRQNEPGAAPAGFAVTESAWSSADSGLVLGSAPCDGNAYCDLLLATDDGGSSWSEQPLPDIPDGAEFDDLFVAEADGKQTWLLTTEGVSSNKPVVFVSYDGRTWQREDFGGRQVSVRTAKLVGDHVYAMGSWASRRTFRAPVGEDKWELVSGLPSGYSNYEPEFAVRGDSALFYNGATPSGNGLATTTNGTDWTVRQSPCHPENDYLDVAVGAADAMYVVCDDGELGAPVRVFASDDAGASFTKAGELDWPYSFVTDTAAFDDTIVAGSSGTYDDPGCFVRSSFDGGATWEETLAVKGGETHLADLEFTDERHGVAKCASSRPLGPEPVAAKGVEVYRTDDGGRTWEPLGLASEGPGASEWLDPVASSWTSDQTGYVLGWTPCLEQGYCAAILATQDGGTTWTERPTPELDWRHDTAQKAMSMFFTERNGSSVGLIARGGLEPEQLFATYDGGESWQRADLGGVQLDEVVDMTATSTHLQVLADIGEQTTLYQTPIGEDDWTHVENVTNPARADSYEELGSLDARGDTGVAFVRGDGKVPGFVWATKDGSTWEKLKRPCPPYASQSYLDGGDGQLYANCLGRGQYDPTLFMASDDGGKTFVQLGNGPGEGNVTEGTAVGDSVLESTDYNFGYCTVHVSADGGASWKGRTLASEAYDSSPVDPQFHDANTATVLCFGGGDGVGGGALSRTTDGGKTWKRLELH